VLTQGIIPVLSTAAHAWLASSITAGAFVIQFCVIGGWISHYIRVQGEVTSAARLVPIASLLGLLLIVIGVFGRLFVFLFGPLLIFSGATLLFCAARSLRHRGPRRQQRLATLTAGAVLVGGLWLIGRTMLPILINMQAFTYLQAAGKLNPASPLTPAARTEYFERMEQAGKWMTQIDPTYFFGYGYIGYVHYFRANSGESKTANYKASVEAYDQAIRVSGDNFIDYYYCRALAHHKLGNESQSREDCRTFVAIEA
jgi:hypothetical protein